MEASTMQTPEDAFSYVTPIGYTNSSSCGYCGGGRRGKSVFKKRYSYYATTTSMTPEFYQGLLDHYWRRSGSLLYRPNQRQSCCPHYTIRLDATLYKPSRDHRQTVNRFNTHVLGKDYAEKSSHVKRHSKADKKKRQTEFDLLERIHEAELDKMSVPPEPAHKLSVTLEHDDFTEEKFLVYENYQRVVHKEKPSEITRTGFRRFLCDSPLRRTVEKTSDGKDKHLGSYHHCYRLDGKLVAIGVLDLLPQCVSAVYFLYHESIHQFSPGKLGAIREIALALEGGYRYWYPGFYIHSCPKMRYKIDYSPQYVLDPESLSWDLLGPEILGLLDKSAYVSYSASQKRAALKDGELSDILESDVVIGDDTVDEEPPLLFNTDMPGISSLSDMAKLDLGNIALRVPGQQDLVTTGDLVIWREQGLSAEGGLKTKIAELVAAMGPELKESLCLDFSR
ncbi:arginyl-tRNA-protein transferase [Plectosphaerella plurivora]|uniref:arginyltransferase n=1 Tax=Plectosphaerella plurivora TaxID=936078 RepID=A0A9P8VEX5_9PEZI|nr:arginyl-tRNA-protein transferase [Plectosphaerella plurivora]